MTETLEAVARAIAEDYGEDYDAVPKHKSEWVKTRGEYQGRYRDVNEPFRCEYDEMARAATTALVARMREPSEGVIHAVCGANAGCVNECDRCPETIKTSYGDGTQACRLIAIDQCQAFVDQFEKETLT